MKSSEKVLRAIKSKNGHSELEKPKGAIKNQNEQLKAQKVQMETGLKTYLATLLNDTAIGYSSVYSPCMDVQYEQGTSLV